MRKYLLFMLLLFLSFACQRQAKQPQQVQQQVTVPGTTATAAPEQDLEIPPRPSKYIVYSGPVSAKTMFEFFDTVPYRPDFCDFPPKSYLPREFYTLLGASPSDSVYFIPGFKTEVFGKYLVLYFKKRVYDTTGGYWNGRPVLYSFDTAGSLIDFIGFDLDWSDCFYVLSDTTGNFYIYSQSATKANCLDYDSILKQSDCISFTDYDDFLEDVYGLNPETGKFVKNRVAYASSKNITAKDTALKIYKTYSNGEYFYSELTLANYTDSGFDFYLFVAPQNTDYVHIPSGRITGTAKFVFPGKALARIGDCILRFEFQGDTAIFVKETDCKEFRHEKVTFDGLYEEGASGNCYCPYVFGKYSY